MPARAALVIGGRPLCLRCWKYQVQGIGGYSVPVYLLNTDIPENSEWDRKLTSVFYGGDSSIVDGWWMEGLIEGVTGWAIGDEKREREDESSGLRDAASLYDELERVIVPLFYGDRNRYSEVMRHAIAANGSFFNTQRMLQQYVLNAYFR
jgi:glucan phosphorylase